MGVNAAQHLINKASFHSTFPIMVFTEIFGCKGNGRKFESCIESQVIFQVYGINGTKFTYITRQDLNLVSSPLDLCAMPLS